MNDTTLLSQLSLPQNALVFDLDALYTCLQTIPDHRARRGRQYALAMILMIGVLAKLAGQDSSRGMAHWAKLRTMETGGGMIGHLERPIFFAALWIAGGWPILTSWLVFSESVGAFRSLSA